MYMFARALYGEQRARSRPQCVNAGTLSGSGTVGGDLIAVAANVSPGASPGVLTVDSVVSTLDINELVPNFNGTGNWRGGDFTGDGNVNTLDINALVPFFNKSYGSGGGVSGVPEPSSVVLLLMAAMGMATAWRRRGRAL